MIRQTVKSFIGNHDFLKDKKLDLRPEKLSVQEFVDLANHIKQLVEQK